MPKFTKHASIRKGLEAAASSPAVWTVAAAPVADYLVSSGMKGIDKLVDAQKKTKAYKKMMQENPDMKRFPAETSKRYFDTLYRFNPEAAKDPLLSRAYVENAAELSDAGKQIGLQHTGLRNMASEAATLRRNALPPMQRQSPFSSGLRDILGNQKFMREAEGRAQAQELSQRQADEIARLQSRLSGRG